MREAQGVRSCLQVHQVCGGLSTGMPNGIMLHCCTYYWCARSEGLAFSELLILALRLPGLLSRFAVRFGSHEEVRNTKHQCDKLAAHQICHLPTTNAKSSSKPALFVRGSGFSPQ